jgi:Ca2+-transporting ATPase
MRRPPRDANERLFSLKTIGPALLQGGTALATSLAVYLLARPGHGDDAARALTFASLVVSFFAIILTNRSWTQTILGSLQNPNASLWWVLGGSSAFLAMVLTWPVTQRLFHFAPLHSRDLLLACLAGFASILWFEGYKALHHRSFTAA